MDQCQRVIRKSESMEEVEQASETLRRLFFWTRLQRRTQAEAKRLGVLELADEKKWIAKYMYWMAEDISHGQNLRKEWTAQLDQLDKNADDHTINESIMEQMRHVTNFCRSCLKQGLFKPVLIGRDRLDCAHCTYGRFKSV